MREGDTVPNRRDVLIGLSAIVPFALVGEAEAANHRRRGLCQGCNGNRKCARALRCVHGRCVPKSHPLTCGGAYTNCNNGKQPGCINGVATCPGNKPATPYCG
jgi:hypothetical protein